MLPEYYLLPPYLGAHLGRGTNHLFPLPQRAPAGLSEGCPHTRQGCFVSHSTSTSMGAETKSPGGWEGDDRLPLLASGPGAWKKVGDSACGRLSLAKPPRAWMGPCSWPQGSAVGTCHLGMQSLRPETAAGTGDSEGFLASSKCLVTETS